MDTCISCGKYVPEGRMVCKQCEESYTTHHPISEVEKILDSDEIKEFFAGKEEWITFLL